MFAGSIETSFTPPGITDPEESTPADDPGSGDEAGGRPRASEIPCRNHPDRGSATLCSRCADLICELCSIRLEGTDFCPTCVVKVRADVMNVGAYIPWENRARLGTVQAAWQTVQAAFARPDQFTSRMPLQGGIADPLLFGMLMRGIVLVCYAVLFGGFYLIIGVATGEPMMFLHAGVQFGSIFINIIQAAAFLFMLAGLLHLGVMVAGGTRGFEATFRVYAYGRAVDVLELIPILGLFAAVGMRIYVHYLGLRAAHALSPGTAVTIASLPVLLWFFFVMFIVGIMVVLVMLVASL